MTLPPAIRHLTSAIVLLPAGILAVLATAALTALAVDDPDLLDHGPTEG